MVKQEVYQLLMLLISCKMYVKNHLIILFTRFAMLMKLNSILNYDFTENTIFLKKALPIYVEKSHESRRP